MITTTSPFGPHDGSMLSYSHGLPEKEGYSDAEVFYPASATAAGRLPIVACCYGFGGSKQTFAAEWTRFLTSWGFVVILFDPYFTIGGIGGGPGELNRLIAPPLRAFSINQALKTLKDENTRMDSPLRGLLEPGNCAVMGHSLGGCAALLAANVNQTIRAVVALEPCNAIPINQKELPPNVPSFPLIFGYYSTNKSPSLLVAGSADNVAQPEQIRLQYETIPDKTSKAYVEFKGATHADAQPSSSNFETGRMALQWLMRYATGNAKVTVAPTDTSIVTDFMYNDKGIRPQILITPAQERTALIVAVSVLAAIAAFGIVATIGLGACYRRARVSGGSGGGGL